MNQRRDPDAVGVDKNFEPQTGAPALGVGAWARNNLVALGSAAVIAVYSAGYVRTKSAADEFENESVRRRPPMRSDGPEIAGTPSPRNAAAPALRHPTPAAAPAAATPTVSRPSTAPSAPRPAPGSTAAVGAPAPPPASAPAVVAVRTPDSSKAPTTTPPAAPPVNDTAAAPSKAQVVDTTEQQQQDKDPPRPMWRDGTFTGWGTSRHGDIQAAVEIRDGRIYSAWVTQCLTRYSCSWIHGLPQQVVDRQSADVDYVSGATQSSNAFYYAIYKALTKAK